jgi:hypothetical protein
MKKWKDCRRRYGKARSNRIEEARRRYLRALYLNNCKGIERRFLTSLDCKELSDVERMRAIRSFREGAIEILSTAEEVFGIEGVEEISRRLRLSDNLRISDFLADDDCDDDCEDEYEHDFAGDDIDDIPRTFEELNTDRAKPYEHFGYWRQTSVELVDRDEDDLADEDGEGDDDEDHELDILRRLMDWGLLMDQEDDFDPMYG